MALKIHFAQVRDRITHHHPLQEHVVGARGPRPQPTRLKVLSGNPGKRRLPKAEPQPVGPAEPPGFVTGAALEEWHRVVGAMPPGLFTAADTPTLAVYCLAWVQYRAALALVAREGTIVPGSMGQQAPHPAVAISVKQAELILRTADRLGMSPAARARLEVQDQPPPAGKFDGLIGRRGDLRLVT
jgi:P27 family predicted phage terminase small subunit